jgi:hypothetical protein
MTTGDGGEVCSATRDYVSPGLATVILDYAFPHLAVGDVSQVPWPYLRREVPHRWYVDSRYPRCGFLSRDEAHILFNTALAFRGHRALEIGCWKGWSTCHLLAAGVHLDVIDPVLGLEEFRGDVSAAIDAVRVRERVDAAAHLWAEESPEAVDRLGATGRAPWSLIFIDGSHDAPAPLADATSAERYAADDSIILLHDAVCPAVAEGLRYLDRRGWSTSVYQTMQMMGVAWRGRARPVPHRPDRRIPWTVPVHLRDVPVIGLA